jgi:hypothetical protein
MFQNDDFVEVYAKATGEQAKDKPRSTLVDALQAVIDAPPPTDPPGSSDGTTPADGQKES